MWVTVKKLHQYITLSIYMEENDPSVMDAVIVIGLIKEASVLHGAKNGMPRRENQGENQVDYPTNKESLKENEKPISTVGLIENATLEQINTKLFIPIRLIYSVSIGS